MNRSCIYCKKKRIEPPQPKPPQSEPPQSKPILEKKTVPIDLDQDEQETRKWLIACRTELRRP
ncbi:MAG: hypothetical protein ACRCUY_04475 [Thermoguttaceae bacterium]